MSKNTETVCALKKVKKQMDLPEEFFNRLSSKGKNIVAVVPNDMRKIILFPTEAEAGLYCKILIRKKSRLDDSFFMELRKILAEFKLKTLYTTGVCFSKDECYWEGVFEHTPEFPLSNFEEKLKTIDSVVEIKTSILNPT